MLPGWCCESKIVHCQGENQESIFLLSLLTVRTLYLELGNSLGEVAASF
jgi:hypothetical protein